MYSYALTARKTSYPVFITDYEQFLTTFKTKVASITEIECHYEDTSGLHFHAIITTPRRIYIKSFHPGHGWNLDFKLLDTEEDIRRWKEYIKKDTDNEVNLINDQYQMVNDCYKTEYKI